MTAGAQPSAPVSGIVIAQGSPDESGEDRFVLIRDATGRPHYGRIRDGEDYRDLRMGSLAELGAGTDRRRQVTEQITAVAKANGGAYSAPLHESFLRTSQPTLSDREVNSLVRSATARLAFVAGQDQSGVRALADGQYAVDPERYQAFSQRGASRTDVRVIATHSLPEQVSAHDMTWLDRHAFGNRPDARLRDHPAVQAGVYHGGKLAVVLADYSIVVANVTRTPDIAPGCAVTLERGPGRTAMVRLSAGRGLDQGMEAGR